MSGVPVSASSPEKPKSSSHARFASTMMPSGTCVMASAEPSRKFCSCSRYSRADDSVVESARSRRWARSSRVATDCSRLRLARVTTSCAPRAMASAMAASSTRSRMMSTGIPGALCCLIFMREARSMPSSSMKATSISGLICVSASPRSRASGSHVQCTGWPALRKVLLIASTWSCDLVITIIGTAPCSVTGQNPLEKGSKCNTWDLSNLGLASTLTGARGSYRGKSAGNWPRSGVAAMIRALQSPRPSMANYSTNEFKSGLKILIDGDPYAIVDNEMVKPGKGQAFNRVRVRNLKTGRPIERTWKSGDTVEAADVVDTDMQYLYSDGEFFHFMVPDTFEQVTASKQAVGDSAQWLKDGTVCIVTLWNGVPLQVVPPAHMELKVIETDPGLGGDTATGGSKPAKLETGAMVRVPLFINSRETLRIDPRTGEYLSRGKG